MQNVKPEHTFWAKNGTAIKNIKELANALKTMDHPTYNHHVTINNNDFANWAEHCLDDKQLANSLRNARNKHHSHRIVNEHINKKTAPIRTTPYKTMVKKQQPKPTKKTPRNNKPKRQTPRIITTPYKTMLRLNHERNQQKPRKPKQHKPIISKHKTTLALHHPRETPKQNDHLMTAAYVTLGIVFGTAMTILFLL